MPTTTQIADLSRRSELAADSAQRAIRSVFAGLRPQDPQAGTDALLELVPPLVAGHADVAAVLAADWYADIRPAGAAAFSSSLAPPPPVEQTEAMVRWSVGPAWEAGDWDAALSRLVDGSTRITRDGARETTRLNALADPAAGGFVRVARPGACPFCLMLAARGAIYNDERSATTVGVHRRPRGARQAGQSFHDNCHCTTSPVFTPDDVPDLNRTLADRWAEVTAGKTGAAARQAWSDSFTLT